MTRKDKKNRTCKCCGKTFSIPQKFHQHYASNKILCKLFNLEIEESSESEYYTADEEIEYLDALGLFDSSEIGESSHSESTPSPEAEREYLETLGILEPILQFHQTDIISSGCELLNDHYQ
ncbi:5499_t:CDS:2, partial [Diversispora eburnea]